MEDHTVGSAVGVNNCEHTLIENVAHKVGFAFEDGLIDDLSGLKLSEGAR